MSKEHTVGIDVGTRTTRVIVTVPEEGSAAPRVVGTGEALTKGMRLGYITDPLAAAESIKEAVKDAEKSSGFRIKRAYVSIGGQSLEGRTGQGVSFIPKSESKITHADIVRAMNESEEQIDLSNKKVLANIPVSYKLDGKKIYGRPEGMRGAKLEVKTFFVTVAETHANDLLKAFEEAGIEVLDVLAAPLATSTVALSERQQVAGSVLLEIGAETVLVSVYEEGMPLSLECFPLGSSDITNDIALGFRIAPEDAEGLKIGNLIGDYPKKKLDEIITARLSDIFELTEKHLKKLGRNGLLPGGVVLAGGGAKVFGIEDMAKEDLRLPSKLAKNELAGAKAKLRDISWLTAYGLCAAHGYESEHEESATLSGLVESVRSFFRSLGKQLLP